MDETDQLVNLINKDWFVSEENTMIPTGSLDFNLLREKLAIVIGNMIHDDFEKLCQAMYRLDVSESKFHQILTEKPSTEIPLYLADLVIERELQKVRTRMMYKRKKL
jgi:hypothetical protein